MATNDLNSKSLAGLDLMWQYTGMEVDINDGRIVGYAYPKKKQKPQLREQPGNQCN